MKTRGCPVPKIVKNGEGSALMKNLVLVYDIIKANSFIYKRAQGS
ncbi:MAG: tRNA-dihydrouridine synthase [Christensenellales bacterium]